jgi:hypothetical protein
VWTVVREGEHRIAYVGEASNLMKRQREHVIWTLGGGYLKEEIGWLKVVFAVLAAIDASLMGWLAQNYTTASRLLVVAGTAATVAITVGIVRINRLAYRRIKQLEDV